MATGIPYLGSKISLISKSEIRYEGILYTIDTKESTVALAKVRSYGTEDRPTDRPVAPRDETYEYIIFRGADIKDIRVCQGPKPQPTLEGGLPNDPAIVQHSGGPPLGVFAGQAGQTGAPGAAPFTSQAGKASVTPAGSSAYGPVGSTSVPGGAPGAFSAAPGSAVSTNQQKKRKNTRVRRSSTRSSRRKNSNGSPVMDMLRDGARSGQSSPVQAQRERRPSSRTSAGMQNGRGGRGRGTFRGPRGYRGGNPPMGGFRGGPQGMRGGFQPGRPLANKKETLKFEKEYDFEEANKEFSEVLLKLQKTSLEVDGDVEKHDAENDHHSDAEDGEILDEGGERKTPSTDAHQSGASNDEPTPVYYDKKKSFFDTISCEAVERSKGKVNKPDWKAEKKLNRETFGVAGNVGRRNFFPAPGSGNMRGRGGYGGGGGYYNRGGYGGGGGYYNRGGYRGGYGGQGGGYGFNNGGFRGRGRGGGENFGGRGGRGMGRGRGWGDQRVQ